MAEPLLVDERARRAIREDLDTTFVVEAAAGTGKTTELVRRIVAVLLAEKATLDRIVAVTFTEKAAGEMKLRLRGEIERERASAERTPEERARLDQALAQLEVARIATIHALCADLLRERPVEAGIDPLFEVAAEDEADRLFDDCFERWFQATLESPPEGVRRILRRAGRGQGSPREVLRDAAKKLGYHRDFDAAWARAPFEREHAIDGAIARLAEVAELGLKASSPRDPLARNLLDVQRFVSELPRRESGRPRDYDGLEVELEALLRDWGWKNDGRGKAFGSGLTRQEVLAAREAVRVEVEAVLAAAKADLASKLRDELRPILAGYAEEKARAGKVDFLDLLLGARDLVKHNRGVRTELAERFERLFVDEFQDTDPLQAELLLLLAADDPSETDATKVRPIAGKLFFVGDPKQSIYRFRRADVALYEAVKQRLLGLGAKLLHLSTSFRSAPAIQDAVNAAFAPVMTGGNGLDPAQPVTQARYVPLERFRAEHDGQPSLIALPVPRPYAPSGRITHAAIEQSLPDAVGALVDWLVNDSGYTVSVRSGEREPLEARHVCLLFKRFQAFGTDATRPYVRALEARKIPHVIVGGRSFHDREEVMAVRTALTAIEWPDDELAVYATLRGTLFALGDAALLVYRGAGAHGTALGRLDPLRPPPENVPEEAKEVGDALAVLRTLHLARNRRSIADTIGALLEATRAHAGIAIWPAGEQALANVLRVMDKARRFEASGATSFRAFVERLDEEMREGKASDAPVVEEGTEGVRLMTVHKAKGLEFPVVVLVDPTAPASPTSPSHHVDQARGLWAEPLAGCVPQDLADHWDEGRRRDREETTRLAYVAATRARDLLVVPVVGDRELTGRWLEELNPVVYPAPDKRRDAAPLPRGPVFGGDSVLERPLGCEGAAEASVAPGFHTPRAGTHRVAWWDPALLSLDREPAGGLRQQRILSADASGEVSRAGIDAHAAWKGHLDGLLVRGAAPTLSVKTATELSTAVGAGQSRGQPSTLVIAKEATTVERRGRPRGKRFGTLVHAVLAQVALDADEATVSRAAVAEGRAMGAAAEEISASAVAVSTALLHPLLERARASAALGTCRREACVLLPLADGAVMEGVIDLAFREVDPRGARWIVVDFKTDADVGERLSAYQEQVRLYARAITEATGEAAEGVLLSV